MSAAPPITPLWRLAREQPYIDAPALAAAIDAQLASGDLDYRTRLLICRGVEALRDKWNKADYDRWFAQVSEHPRLREILREEFEEEGFPHLRHSVVMATTPDTVRRFLSEVDGLLRERLQIVVGGSVSAILRGYLCRQTNDIDIVDEVPLEIREHHADLARLAARWGLELGHFQSHYLPAGWRERITWWDDFRHLSVYLIDPCDLYVGKLFSRRDKDLDDLRVLVDLLDKSKVVERLADAAGMLASPIEREKAQKNWYVLYGEPLPASLSDQEHKL